MSLEGFYWLLGKVNVKLQLVCILRIHMYAVRVRVYQYTTIIYADSWDYKQKFITRRADYHTKSRY